MQCPICHEELDLEVSECRCGANFCTPCLNRSYQISDRCPSCRQRLPHPFPRNIYLQNLLGKRVKSCQHEGCTEKPIRDKLAAHEAACPYTTEHCPGRSCAWAGIRRDLAEHIGSCFSYKVAVEGQAIASQDSHSGKEARGSRFKAQEYGIQVWCTGNMFVFVAILDSRLTKCATSETCKK